MYNISLINTVLDWERRLEIEADRRKALRLEPYRELSSEFVPVTKKRKTLFEWVSRPRKTRQTAYKSKHQEQCRELSTG